MKKTLSIALMGATVLCLFSCKGNNPPSTSTSGTDPKKNFTEEQLGLMKGHFIGEKYELDLSASASSMYDSKNESRQNLEITDIKKEKYVSETITDVSSFDIDYLYLEDKEQSSVQYRVSIPKEDYASLKLEKYDQEKWKTEDNLYLWDNNYVGTWATTEETAGFVQTVIFTDDFITPISGSDLKLPTGKFFYIDSVWYPQFATYKNEKTNEYETSLQVLVYDQDDLTEFMFDFALIPSTDENYPIALYYVSYGWEYLYPSAEYYKGNWYTKDGKISISESEEANKLKYNDTVYQSEVVKDDDYGWVTHLKADNKDLVLRPFVGGFTIESNNETVEAVSLNTEDLKGTWLYGNKEISVSTEYDEDYNEVLKVTVDGSEVTPTYVARNRKFTLQFTLDGQQAYLSVVHKNAVATLNVNNQDVYVCTREVYDENFVRAGKLVTSESAGLLLNRLETLVVNDDFTVTYNNVSYPATYEYDDEMRAVRVTFDYKDKTYALYVFSLEGVYLLEKDMSANKYSIFASESYLEGFVADWTSRGATATLKIDENYNVNFKDLNYAVTFDYDLNLGFYMFFTNQSSTVAYMLYLSSGTLMYSKIGYQGDELTTLEEDWYIKVEDYKKIEGTYIYVGDQGKEYVIIGDDETVQITTLVDGKNVLKDYSGQDVHYSYLNGEVCLTFKVEGSNTYVYVYLNGLRVNFFDRLFYVQEVLMNNQGYFTDGTNILSIGGQEVYFNGNKVTLESAQGNQLVFTDSGIKYTVTIKNDVATVVGGENTLTLNKGTFNLKDYAGSWTIDNVEYSLTVKENTDGSLKYAFTYSGNTYTDYQVTVVNGKAVVTFNILMSKYVITIDENGIATLSIESSIPLPPPPPPLAFEN